MIKHRTFKWCVAADLLREEYDTIWIVNPEGAVMLAHKNKKKLFFLDNNTAIIGIYDGSFKIDENMITHSGIGGFIMNTNEEVIYMFSGPSQASSPVEAKIEAIIFLASVFEENFAELDKWIIRTDCVTAIQSFANQKAGKLDRFDYLDKWALLSKNKKVSLFFSPRDLLEKADSLAKMGSNRPDMLQSWC